MNTSTKNVKKFSLLNSNVFWFGLILFLILLFILLILYLHNKNNKSNYTQKTNTRKDNLAGCGRDASEYILSEDLAQKLCNANPICKGYYMDTGVYALSDLEPSINECDNWLGSLPYFKTKSDNYIQKSANSNPSNHVCINDTKFAYPGSCANSKDCEQKIKFFCDNSDNCVGYYKNSTSDTFIVAKKPPETCDTDNIKDSQYDSTDDDYQKDYVYFIEKNT
jgi:hypothetical protein